MKDFIKVVKEIQRTLNFLIIFKTTMNSVIFFLILYLLLSLINLFPLLALIPTLVYFVTRMYATSKEDKRLMVEKKYEPLKEKLRTAADNYKDTGPVVSELQDEVVNDLKSVGLSSFINTKDISYKIVAIIALSFSILFATTFNLYIVDLNEFLFNLPKYIDQINPIKRTSIAALGDVNESGNIYGDSKLAVLGNQEIDIRIKPVSYEVNIREEGDLDQKQFDEIFPSDVNVEQSSAYDERIPEEQQDLVKKYFDRLAKG